MDREQVVADLMKTDLFRGMDLSDVVAVAEIVEERFSPPGQHVFFQGDISTEFFVVSTGRVRVYVPGNRGEVDMGIVSDGQMFGEGGLVDGGPRVASAIALDPSTLLTIPRNEWLYLLEEFPNVGRRVLVAIGASFRRYFTDAVDLLFLDVEIPEYPPDEGLPSGERGPLIG